MGTEQAIDRLYISAHQYSAYTIEELSALLDMRIDAKKLRSLIIDDRRFVYLSESSNNNEHFIVDSTLFRWFCNLNFILSRVGKFRISDHQFASKLSALRNKGRWDSSPITAIKWGHSIGLVSPFWDTREYAFPLARLLSSMQKKTYEMSCEILTEFCNRRIWASKLLSKDVNYYIEKGFSQFEEQIANIVRNREALKSGKKVTLQKLGKMYGLTRERIRQLEKGFWDSVQDERYNKPFIQGYLVDFFYSKGSLVLENNLPKTFRRNFLAKCIEVPQLNLDKIELTIHAFRSRNITHFEPMARFPNNMNSDVPGDRFQSEGNLAFSKKDIKLLSEKTTKFSLKKLTLAQRVYLALKSIGRPAHFSEIAASYNELWPDRYTSERNIHSVLIRQRYGIVWIGIKGTYALKEWGYERPSKTLFETTTEIVKRKFKELSAPVPYTIIAAEMGRYRKIVIPSSVTLATYCNPELVKIGKDAFIPKDESQEDHKEISLDELDKIFKEFQEKNLESHN